MELVSFLPEGYFCGLVVDYVVLREEIVAPVPPKGERGLEAFDSVGVTEEVIEDFGYFVCSGGREARPQKGFNCQETGPKTSRGIVGRLSISILRPTHSVSFLYFRPYEISLFCGSQSTGIACAFGSV